MRAKITVGITIVECGSARSSSCGSTHSKIEPVNRTCHQREIYEGTEASGQYRITDKHTLSGQMTGTAELNELLQCQLMFTRAHNTSLRKEETSKTKRKVGAGENRKARILTDHPHREQKAAQTQQKHF